MKISLEKFSWANRNVLLIVLILIIHLLKTKNESVYLFISILEIVSIKLDVFDCTCTAFVDTLYKNYMYTSYYLITTIRDEM